MKLFFSVGEPSGDLHGANLIRHLKRIHPQVKCVGYGGPRMMAAGGEMIEDLTRFAIVGFSRVIKHLHQFRRLLRQAEQYFREHRPDAVVLIDYPGFNWWIAWAAKRQGIPVFYYGVPQLWGWAPWRVRKMRRYVDHVLCKLPFEETWYRQRGCHAIYVGHPYFDEMHTRALDPAFVQRHEAEAGDLVTILPGSRTQEVKVNLPTLLKAAEHIRDEMPHVRFAVAAFNEKQAAMAREMVARTNLSAPVEVGRTGELIYLAKCCLACSGSVSLELLYHQKPSVILYRCPVVLYVLQRILRRVKYITLVNILASRNPFPKDLSTYDPDRPGAEQVPMPEYVTWLDVSGKLARHVLSWLQDPSQYAWRVAQLAPIKEQIAVAGASQRAAEFVIEHLQHPSDDKAAPAAA
jgi:lipid-A-disaccharide synthase